MTFAERKRQVTPVKEVLEKQDEAEWCLRDVIFVEDSKTVPVGKVVKVRVFTLTHFSKFSPV